MKEKKNENRKQFSQKHSICITFTALKIASLIYFLGFEKDQNAKSYNCIIV